MQYTTLGKTGVQVSRLCLGTMNFGAKTPDAEAFRIFDAALANGINFIDTADMYGMPEPGSTESLLGRWFALGEGRREKTVIATKIWNDIRDPYDGANNRGFSAYRVRRHVEDCLRRLQTDHIDLLYMHEFDPYTSWDEIWYTYDCLIREGKVIYAAGSNLADRQLWRAELTAEKHGMPGLACVQNKYNLLNRLEEVDLLPTLRELNIGFLAWSPLCGGVLSGKGMSDASGRRGRAHAQSDMAKFAEQLSAYAVLCRELGLSEANVSTAWLLSNPALTAPIIGARTVEQLEDTCRAAEMKLDAETLARIEEIFPGPGEAPECYRQ